MAGQIDIAALRLDEETILSQNAQGIVDPFGTDRIFRIDTVSGKISQPSLLKIGKMMLFRVAASS